MDDQARLDPVYNQLSAVRDDLTSSYATPAVSQYGYSDITTQIMNPALVAPSFPMQGFNAELSLMRYQGATEMGGLYEDAMRAQEGRRNWFEVGMGVGSGAAWVAGSAVGTAVAGPIGGFVGGMGASMLFEQLRDPLENLFKINQMDPVVSATDWTKGVISEQVMAMAYMSGGLGPGGRAGLSMDQAESLGENLYGFMRNQGLQGMEITRLAPYIMQSGALDSSANIDELTSKIESQVETIANFVKRSGMRLEEAAQVTSGLVQAGINSNDLLGISTGLISTATAANVDVAQYGQLAANFVQPYAFNGNQANVISSLNQEVLFQDYLYQSGAVSQAEYMAGGRAVGAGGTIAQAGMSYWNSSANRRILYGMTASGGLNAAGINAMLSGDSFPDSGMSAYEAMSSEDRAATRWQSGDILNENAGLFTDVMLARMIGSLEDDGYNDPFAQRQMLMERYGISRGLATQFERREELMFDPRTNMGVQANASQAAAQSSRMQAINEHNQIMQRVLGLGQALNTGENDRLSYGSRQQFRNRILNGEDYATLVQEETADSRSEMAYFLNADLQSLSAGGTMSLDAIQAALATMTPEQRALYGPQMAEAANAALRSDGGAFRSASAGQVISRYNADDRGFGAVVESGSLIGQGVATGGIAPLANMQTSAFGIAGFRSGETTTRYNAETGNFEVFTDGRWWDASDYSFRNFDMNVSTFASTMSMDTEALVAAQSRADVLSGMTSMMPTQTQVLYGQEFQRRYTELYNTPNLLGPRSDIGGAADIQHSYDVSSYVNSAPGAAEARTALTGRIMGSNGALDEWYAGALQQYREAGLTFTGNARSGEEVYGFSNELSRTLFGYSMEDPRFSLQDRQRLDYFTSITYPNISNERSAQMDSAANDMSDAVSNARRATGGGLTAEERSMRASVGRRYDMSEADWSTASDIMMMSYAERISLSQAANRLGVDDQSILDATATVFGTQGAARGAVIAAGPTYAVQMAGADQALARFDSLLDTTVNGRSASMTEAIAAYRRGDTVDFELASGVAGTDLGRKLEILVSTDTLSEEALAAIIEEDNRRSGATSSDSDATGFEGGEVSMSAETVTIEAATVNVGGASSNSSATSVTSGAPGFSRSSGISGNINYD